MQFCLISGVLLFGSWLMNKGNGQKGEKDERKQWFWNVGVLVTFPSLGQNT